MNAVLFDLDETLLDRSASLVDFVRWQASGMLKNSLQNPDAFCTRFIELDAHGTVWKDEVYRQLIDAFEIKDASVESLLSSYVRDFSNFCIPKQGAIEAVRELNALGLKLGLVTNGPSPFQEQNFHALGISECFDAVIVSGAVGLRKPQAEIFERACSQLGVSARDTVFVGDNPKADIGGAQAVGMYTIYIPGVHGSHCDAAHAVCEDFSQLVDLVKNAA